MTTKEAIGELLQMFAKEDVEDCLLQNDILLAAVEDDYKEK